MRLAPVISIIVASVATAIGAASFSPPSTYSFNIDTIFADEPIATRTSVAVDNTLPGHVTTISNWHGNYTMLVLMQGSQAKLYFIYPAVDSIVCKSFILPSMLPPPPVLSKDVLEASGFNAKGLQPLRDDVLLQLSLKVEQYWLQAFADPATGLVTAGTGLDFMGSQYTFSGYSYQRPPPSLFSVPSECATASPLPLSLPIPLTSQHHFLFQSPSISPAAAATAHSALPPLPPPPPSLTRPVSVDWRKQGVVTPVRNQGACGCCWAKSAVATMETNAAVALAVSLPSSTALLQLSSQYLIDCAAQQQQMSGVIPIKGCFGGWPADAMNFSKNSGGLPLEQDYQYAAVSSFCPTSPFPLHSPPKSIMAIPRGDEEAVADAVAQHGAVSAIVETLQDFLKYSGGVYNNSACVGKTLNHAVTIVGYGASEEGSYWIIKNSFGRGWGEEGGFMRMRRGSNMCGIANYAVVPVYQ